MLKTGNKSDRIDARKLAELLRAGLLSAVYHGETGIRTLKELSRSYLDLTRVMNRRRRRFGLPIRAVADHFVQHLKVLHLDDPFFHPVSSMLS